ncbi:type I DNA topoisomerase [bacterium]|nr:type I DNA topoisomerase [bacterium]
MSSKLVIVESPTKAKTIEKFLDKTYKVKSSFGHIRDLPKAKLGVDVDNNFEPEYEIPKKASVKVKELKKLAKNADTIYFATDEDREGEAISWHLAQIFKTPIDQTERITFHEITKEAIKESLKSPRHIDMDMVNSQQARRILDRLVGYKLSPFLWKKITRGLSAGRVQSIVVRLIVEKEKEIQAFKIDNYWEIIGDFQQSKKENFEAKLFKIDSKSLKKLSIDSEEKAQKLFKILSDQEYYVANINKKDTSRNPLAPFTTSSLQQEASRHLHFSAKQTMMLAQRLYEGIKTNNETTGLITYMRTDSLNLSKKFLGEASQYIKDNLGKEYLESKTFKTKSKGAQEAHEAIRPTSAQRTPEELKDVLDPQQFKLYQLIWQRAIASQMSQAKLEATSVSINTKDDKYTFKINGQVIKFAGFLKIYPSSTKDEILPRMEKDEIIKCLEIRPIAKATKPPARYSDATIVKTLEEKGIGRPSTYAPTINTVINRGYTERIDQRRLKPTDIAFVVNDMLVEHFSDIVDYNFTAQMEQNLDEIAEGKQKWQKVIGNFYKPFSNNLKIKEKEIDKKKITEEETDHICEKCNNKMVIKIGRWGKFLACSNYPECKNTKKIDSKGNIAEKKEPELLEEKCPDCGAPLVLRNGRFGKFKGCSKYPDCKYIKKEALKLDNDLELKCPKCKNGKITAKHSRRGIFYGCDQYPKCDFAFWGKPTGKLCKECQAPMIESKDGKKCSDKNCSSRK